jgi:glycosyltransferase involved in cell wall biosynthesis
VDFDFYATQTETTLNFNNIPTIASWRGRYVLGASRFTSQKRLDLVIWSAKWLGLPVVIAGAGPELVNLQSLAKRLSVDAYFALNPSKEFLRDLYQNSAFFAYPPVEDFGIMPVEAMASGAAVLGLNKGGTSESVVDGETGVLIPEFSQDYVLKAWDTLRRISSDACRSRALKFDEANFQLNLLREIEIALVKVGEA